MEYVGEENLQDLLEQIGKIYLTEQKVLNWFIQICLAVQHYHKRKMLCRDLQLHNIFFDSRDTIKIGNFNPIRKIDMNFSKRFRLDNLDLIQPVPPECIEFEQVSEQTEENKRRQREDPACCSKNRSQVTQGQARWRKLQSSRSSASGRNWICQVSDYSGCGRTNVWEQQFQWWRR